MIKGSLYIRTNDKTIRGWGHIEIYKSINELKQYHPETQILIDLDSGYYVAYSSKFVFPTGTNVISASTKEGYVHVSHQCEVVWSSSEQHVDVDFDNAPRD